MLFAPRYREAGCAIAALRPIVVARAAKS